MHKTLGERIREAAKSVGGQRALSSLIDISERALSDYVSDKMSPQVALIEKIATATGVPFDYLVTGRDGEQMPVEVKGHFRPSNVSGSDFSDQQKNADMVFVPILDVQASAGIGAVVEAEPQTGVMALRRDLLRSLGISSTGSLKILEARGNSMEPLIRAGDLLLVDTSIDRVEDEGVYVFRRGSTVIVKRLRLTVLGSVELVSDNGNIAEAIPPEDLPDLHAAGRVVRVIRAV